MILNRNALLAWLASSLVVLSLFGSPSAAETANEAEYRFGAYDEASGAFFAEAKKQSIYVPMPDGTRLAADLYLPSPLDEDAQLPTLLHMTRYWREYQLSWPFEDDKRLNRRAEFFARRGYAVMLIDVRGTGASFGTRPGPHSPKEVQDGCDLAKWVGRQKWADGNVGAFGDSYSGTSAALLATCNDAKIKVVIPRFYEWDVYTDIAYPGGIFHEAFVKTWAAGNAALDANKTPKSLFGFSGAVAVKGVAPAGGKDAADLLEEAVAEHRGNVDVYDLARRAEFRDRSERRGSSTSVSIDSFSLHSRRAALETTPTVIYAWGSWLDAGTARSVIAQVMNLASDVHGIIGPWNHGADHHASPYLPQAVRPVPTVFAQRLEYLKVFDHYLKGESTDLVRAPKLTYFTLGEERWKSTETWPPEGFEARRFYFGSESQLTFEKVAASDSEIDVYEIDFAASTGVQNRWYTQHGDTDVFYGDRGSEGGRRLSYTSPVLTENVEITGHPALELELSSSTIDNAIYVYLEDVAPDGTVRYVTDGQLRLATRHLDDSHLDDSHLDDSHLDDSHLDDPHLDDSRSYELPVPRPSFRESDAASLQPGQIDRVFIAMLPTSALVRAGHRLRLSIAGHDADSFERIPAAGPSTLTLHRSASFLDLPLRPRPDLDVEDAAAPLALSHYAGRYRFPDGGVIRIRSAQAFLHVGAENPEGVSVLEPGWDPSGPWEAEAHRLVEALRMKDKKAVRRLVSGDSFKELWKLRKTLGKGPISFAGSTRWLGEPMTVFQVEAEVEGGRGRRSLMLIWDRANLKVARWGVSESLPGHGRYLARSLTRFEAMDPRPVSWLEFEVDKGQAMALKIDGRRAERIGGPQ